MHLYTLKGSPGSKNILYIKIYLELQLKRQILLLLLLSVVFSTPAFI